MFRETNGEIKREIDDGKIKIQKGVQRNRWRDRRQINTQIDDGYINRLRTRRRIEKKTDDVKINEWIIRCIEKQIERQKMDRDTDWHVDDGQMNRQIDDVQINR